MTKKAETIYKKYCDKLAFERNLYENNITDFEHLQKGLAREEDLFKDLIQSMFEYDLLSQKDFSELWGKAYSTQISIIDEIMELTTII